jgi:hypothetical protein
VKTMSTNFKTLLSLTAFAAFFVSTAAMADYRDYNDKAWNAIYKREHSAAASRSYRSAAPVIVKSEAATSAKVAQAPTKERAYSYEPAKDAGASTPCGGKAAPAPSTAEKVTSNRSFSYEPSTSGPTIRRGSIGSGGSSYERAMRAKGY